MTDKALQVFNFNDQKVRVVTVGSEPWWVAKDVCEILEIEKYRDAVSRLDEDERGSVKVDTLGGPQEMAAISESGLYTLIMRSSKPQAKAFRRWVTHEVLPAIRKTGAYATPSAVGKKTGRNDELAMRRVGVMEKNADCRMAKLILEGMKQFRSVMTPESKTVFMTKYAELTTKQDLTHLLPKAPEKWYSAADLGREFGVSAHKIGVLSNEHRLKAPEGQSNRYGTWIRSKSEHGPKEVMTWVYYEAGREWYADYFGQAEALA